MNKFQWLITDMRSHCLSISFLAKCCHTNFTSVSLHGDGLISQLRPGSSRLSLPLSFFKLLSISRRHWKTQPLCLCPMIFASRLERPIEAWVCRGRSWCTTLGVISHVITTSAAYCENVCKGLQSVSFYRGPAQLMQCSRSANRGELSSLA